MEKNCIICYFPITDSGILCSNFRSCNSKICTDCCESYIEFHYRNNKNIPKCPSSTCKDGEYLVDEIKKLNNRDILKKYYNLHINHLKNDNLDDILLEANQKIMIEKIRKERTEYIKKEFPIAISFIIEKALHNKLKRIDKQNQEHIKDFKRRNNRKCLNPLCYSGILDVDFKCLTCFTQFCKKCEIKLMDTENHICNQEDLESLKLVDSFVKCPQCKLPVVKSFGCDNITCSICKTNFDYITGKITLHGNHSNDTLKLNTPKPLSVIFMEDKDIDSGVVNCMRKIENNEPKSYSFSHVISEFKKYYNLENGILEKGGRLEEIENDLEKIREKISINYQEYQKTRFIKKEYLKYIEILKEHYENKTINIEIANKINYMINILTY
jgi:hypothetical protein